MSPEQLVAVLYAILIISGSGLALMVGKSIHDDLDWRRSFRRHDDAVEHDGVLFAEWTEVCAVLGQNPSGGTPVFDALVRERIAFNREEASA